MLVKILKRDFKGIIVCIKIGKCRGWKWSLEIFIGIIWILLVCMEIKL